MPYLNACSILPRTGCHDDELNFYFPTYCLSCSRRGYYYYCHFPVVQYKKPARLRIDRLVAAAGALHITFMWQVRRGLGTGKDPPSQSKIFIHIYVWLDVHVLPLINQPQVILPAT